MLRKLLSKLQNKHYVLAFAIFHAVVIGAFVLSLLFGEGLNVDSDLFNMLPSSTLGKEMGIADERLTASVSQSVYVLVSHEDFDKAKSTAEEIYNKLKDNDFILSISFNAGTETIDTIEDIVHPYRWNLLDEDTVAKLSTPEGAEDFANNALATAGGFYTLTSLKNLETDPFLLNETITRNYLENIQQAGASLSAKDGVLATQQDGKWYVFLNVMLSKEGAAIATKKNGVSLIYDTCFPLEKDGIDIAFSGVPITSHQSSNNAVFEIGIISSVSLTIVAIILLIIFRNQVPLLASLLSIVISMVTAICATHTVFGKIHILTVLLGTSLIGSCIDYCLHFFMNWKGNLLLNSGAEIRTHLRKGLVLSLCSTVICYIILLFAPFNLLKQMGVFSSIGIFSSFLTVTCIYPMFKLPKTEKRSIPMLKLYHRSPLKNSHKSRTIVTIAMFTVLATILVFNIKNLRIENNTEKLYEMEGEILVDYNTRLAVTNYDPKGWFIVSAETIDEVLEKETKICKELDELGKGRIGYGYVATSKFIPSKTAQLKSIQACKNLLPLLPDQLDMLGIEPEYSGIIEKEIKEAEKNILSPENITMPEEISQLISPLWLGKIDSNYCSVILPATMKDDIDYKGLAAKYDKVYFEDKNADLGRGLDKLTKQLFILFAVAYLIIVIVLKFFYPWRQTIKIARIPLMSVLTIIDVFLLTGNRIEFFCATGMILVFGLGLDYMIYMIENMKHTNESNKDQDHTKLEPFGIIISFVTTAISFGALALSSFVPVHTLGLSICVGLIAAYIGTVF